MFDRISDYSAAFGHPFKTFVLNYGVSWTTHVLVSCIIFTTTSILLFRFSNRRVTKVDLSFFFTLFFVSIGFGLQDWIQSDSTLFVSVFLSCSGTVAWLFTKTIICDGSTNYLTIYPYSSWLLPVPLAGILANILRTLFDPIDGFFMTGEIIRPFIQIGMTLSFIFTYKLWNALRRIQNRYSAHFTKVADQMDLKRT